MKRIAITACPYSGTKHIAKTFLKLKRDVGHEKYGRDGIISWQHIHMSKADFVADGFPDSMVLLHQVRHPLMVISSLRQLTHGHRHPVTQKNIWLRIKELTAAMDTGWDVENAERPLDKRRGLLVWMQLWYWWNKRGAEKADAVYKIEKLPDRWEWFLEQCGIDYVPQPAVSKRINRHRSPHILSWNNLYMADPHLTFEILDLAGKFGYDQEPTEYLGDEFYDFPEQIELTI